MTSDDKLLQEHADEVLKGIEVVGPHSLTKADGYRH
ncbi:hypothetical protein O9992_03210 [Vibrio lentus]|nr:hypothetical protein [Vibrio lentus]